MHHVDATFQDQVARGPDAPFLLYGSRTVSYGAVNALAGRAADALQSTGPVKDRFVGLVAPNRPEYVVAWLAILRAGGRVVPLNPRLGPAEVAHVVADAHVPLVVHVPELDPKLGQPSSELMDEDGARLAFTVVPAGMQGAPPSFPSRLDDVAVCIYTSGTTGRAKGALLTHAALLENAAMCASGLGSQPGMDCFVAVLPLFHAFASSACMLHAMVTGSRLLLIDQFQPQEVLSQMARRHATVFLGVPAMFGVLASLDAPPIIPSWRLSVSGGAPLPSAIPTRFAEKFHMSIHEGDGPTECGPATSVNPIGGVVKTGTIGLPLRGVTMRIADDDLRELPDGTVGEIIVRSPSNFIGYLNQPEETARTLVDGWVRTGDLGMRDSDGYLSIVDRKKDMLLVGGLNVYPREVEDYIGQHPAVAEVAVVGKPDGIRGEIPAACVVLRPDRALTLPDLRAFLRTRIAAYKIPRVLTVLDALPRNATGKVLKTVLRGSFH